MTLDMQEDHDVCGTTLGFYPEEDNPENIVYFLAYKLLPACLYEQSSDNVKSLCSAQNSPGTCGYDPLHYSIAAGQFLTNYKGLRIVGLAKDGHAIYGPYNADDELWDCEDHDICNGRYFSEMDGSYAYVMT